MITIWKLECNANDDEPLYFTTKQKAEEYLARRAKLSSLIIGWMKSTLVTIIDKKCLTNR